MADPIPAQTASTAPADDVLRARLQFIQAAEALKHTLRSAHGSTGRPESTAEHSWRLCLLAMTLEDLLGPLDMLRVLKLCVVHDLGEAIGGDIPAVAQQQVPDKAAQERRDLATLTAPLPPDLAAEFLTLWDEYEAAATPEARAVKALDKLETMIQHNQGANPPGFDYAFNLQYGLKHTQAQPLFAALRRLVDDDTRAHVQGVSNVRGRSRAVD